MLRLNLTTDNDLSMLILYCLPQATVATLDGWVRCMSLDISQDVGDLGALYAVDEHGGVAKVVPKEVSGDDNMGR